jgi:hypothetical protein
VNGIEIGAVDCLESSHVRIATARDSSIDSCDLNAVTRTDSIDQRVKGKDRHSLRSLSLWHLVRGFLQTNQLLVEEQRSVERGGERRRRRRRKRRGPGHLL